jgi:hypothetical protein
MLSPDETVEVTAGPAGGSAGSAMSRRSVLRGAAIAGGAGLTAYSLAGAIGSADAATSPATRPGHDVGIDASAPLVIHISDAHSGRLDIFHGTNQASLRDPDLVARLLRASTS